MPKHHIHSLIAPLFVLLLCTGTAGYAESDAITSYSEGLRAFNAERGAREGQGPLTDADRRVMEREARDLAARIDNPGLRVGARAPDFTLPNASGQPVRLSDLLEQGPVVLVFYRGAWCPYCNLQLRTLTQNQPHFERLGAAVVAVTPQRPDKSLQQVQEEGHPFEILSDLDSRVMQAYGLYFELSPELVKVYKERLSLDLAEYNGEGRYVLPIPATYIIDQDGIVRAGEADTDYKQRMEPADIVAALEGLRDRL